MHYKNGREAKIGDQVVGKDTNGNSVSGMLVKGFPGSETCNGQILPMAIVYHYSCCVTLKDCLHIEDFDKGGD